jgi:hypothetical protein
MDVLTSPETGLDPISWLVHADWLEEYDGLYDPAAYLEPRVWRLRALIALRIGLKPHIGAFQLPFGQGLLDLENGWYMVILRRPKTYVVRAWNGRNMQPTILARWHYASADRDPRYLMHRLFELASRIDRAEQLYVRQEGFIRLLQRGWHEGLDK